jgi:hypothetical protein
MINGVFNIVGVLNRLPHQKSPTESPIKGGAISEKIYISPFYLVISKFS